MKSLMGNPVNGDQSMVVLGLCAFWGNTDGGDYVTDMCQIRVNSVALCIIASHNACLMPLTSFMSGRKLSANSTRQNRNIVFDH